MDVKSMIKMTKIIRYLENQEITHECMEIEELPIEEVLFEYGVHTVLSKGEQLELKEYLLRRATQAEVAEAVRWAANEYGMV